MNKKYIEVHVHSHMILHGFDANNQEIIEHVEVEESNKKLIAKDRILSLSEKYILTTYAFDRLVYWEYDEDYEVVKRLLD